MEEGYALTFVIPHLKRHHLHELFPIELNAELTNLFLYCFQNP